MTSPERTTAGDVDRDEPEGWVGLLFLAGLVLLLALAGGLSTLIVVMAIVIMIFMHELGHYLTARSAGMKVTEFFLGFGPRIWSFRRGETEYGVKAIFAGAYVRIIGMNNLEEVDPADEVRTYRQAPFWRRLSVAVAGSTMHFLMAIAMLFVLFVGPGFRGFDIGTDVLTTDDWQVSSISEDSAAEAIGVMAGDRILGLDGVNLETFDELRAAVLDRPGETVTVIVGRDGEVLELTGVLGTNDEGMGFLGVGPQLVPAAPDNVVVAAGKSVEEFAVVTKESVVQIGLFFTPGGLSDFFAQVFEAGDEPAPEEASAPSQAGPDSDDEGRIISIYGATRIGSALTETGVEGLLEFMIILNIFIGVFNLMPLLPLDGGHVVIAVYERIRSRPGRRYHADVAKLLPLTYVVLFVLLSVGIAALYLDIRDPIV